MGRRHAGAAHVRSRGAAQRRSGGARRGIRLARPAGGRLARGGARRSDQLHLTEFTEGIDLGSGLGSGAGQPGRARAAPPELVERGYRVVLSARGHGSLERVREFARGPRRSRGRRGRAGERVRLPGRQARGRDRGGPVRLAAAHAQGAEVHDPPDRRDRRGARAGDFAVHRVHGVGRYVGIHRPRDRWLRARLHGARVTPAGDRLSVPTDQVGMVARYSAATRRASRAWARATGPHDPGRVKRAVKDMAGELVRLYSVRMSIEGHAFGPDTPWQIELEDAFPHEETGDQVTAIEEVKADMERPQADGPPDLRRRRVRQDRDRRARRVQGGDGRASRSRCWCRRRCSPSSTSSRSASAIAPFPVEGRDALALRLEGRAGPHRRGPAPRRDRRRDRHAPAALVRHRVQGPRASSSSTRSSGSASPTRSG